MMFMPRFVAFISFLSISGCYLAHAARGQASLLLGRQNIDDVIHSPDTDESTRKKLEHVLTVRAWAHDKLGLSANSFRKFTKLDRRAVAWNVSASRELRFEPHTWWFPIVGTVPYLGFFEESKALAEADKLRREGWEAIVTEVAGYSTLGWFEDPLVSPQLEYSEWGLTRLVIHECTHATVWLPGSVDFNESFASFVELEGAMTYVRDKYGVESEEYKKRILQEEESSRVRFLFHRLAQSLNAIYESNATNEEKRNQKRETIAAFRAMLLSKIPEFKAVNMRAVAERDLNNAHMLSFLRYESGEEYFRNQFKECNAKWPCFLDHMKSLKEEPSGWKTSRKVPESAQ